MSSERRSKLTPAEMVYHARRRIAMIVAWTKDDTAESYLANDERQAAVERNFIAIGEAIKDLARAKDLAAIDPTGPWRQPARFRDFLAHQYEEGVSHPDVWRTIHEDLPVLDASLARLEPLVGGAWLPDTD
jgi:uncharacterized protein with HEPN domain